MRRMVFIALLLAGAAWLAPSLVSGISHHRAAAQDRPQRGKAQGGPGAGQGRRGQPGGRFGGGGFRFPPPPILAALDTNRDGEISAQELAKAEQLLKALDKNKDGQLSGNELIPDFGGQPGGRGRGGFGGGRRTPGKPLDPKDLAFRDGVAEILDHSTYHKLSYRGDEVLIDTFLAGIEFVKFTIQNATKPETRKIYFINTKTHRAHMMFASAVGLPGGFRGGGDQMKGVLAYRPKLKGPNGQPGLFTFEFEPNDRYTYKMIKIAQATLIKKMPLLKGRIGYYPRQAGIDAYEGDKAAFEKAGDVKVYLEKDLINTDIAYLPLNLAESFGRLRLMKAGERPSPRDIVLFNALPNELPRVAGVITAVRQTPLSHVNLRAIQDKVPNAFVTDAATNNMIRPLIGKQVYYKVTRDGFEIREATSKEVELHFAHLRPKKKQIPKRDLTVKKIRALDNIKFQDSTSVGVKAANVATLRTFGLAKGTIPDGFAIPFHFYDAFMKHNRFYDQANEMLADAEFRSDGKTRAASLKRFRSQIKKGKMPDWMMQALDQWHKKSPAGSSLRCRSSTNNEDLPGFSGAGLYDSVTHRSKEGHLSKSIKQVYASLWNFRAFEERDFYRVDHLRTAMGVLVHPNFKGEIANGVAVTDDILYETEGNYYLNTQVGEDLVTNPKQASVPEEVLVDWRRTSKVRVMRRSNRAPKGKQLLDEDQLDQLRDYLGIIHAKFARLYGTDLEDENFAMEIEFKITRDGKLSIKQARPWVYHHATNSEEAQR